MAARNRRGRGYIETLPSGSYRAVVPSGMDPLTGRRRNLRETTATSAEAEVALTKLQRQVDENKHPKSAITVAEAIERWLEVVKLEETTRDRYEDLIRLYILPKLGDMQAGKVDAELLERLYARLERCRGLCSGRPPKGHICRPLSPSTTRKIHFTVRGTHGLAVRWNYLGFNPAELGAYLVEDSFRTETCRRETAIVLLPRSEFITVLPGGGSKHSRYRSVDQPLATFSDQGGAPSPSANPAPSRGYTSGLRLPPVR